MWRLLRVRGFPRLPQLSETAGLPRESQATGLWVLAVSWPAAGATCGAREEVAVPRPGGPRAPPGGPPCLVPGGAAWETGTWAAGALPLGRKPPPPLLRTRFPSHPPRGGQGISTALPAASGACSCCSCWGLGLRPGAPSAGGHQGGGPSCKACPSPFATQNNPTRQAQAPYFL